MNLNLKNTATGEFFSSLFKVLFEIAVENRLNGQTIKKASKRYCVLTDSEILLSCFCVGPPEGQCICSFELFTYDSTACKMY